MPTDRSPTHAARITWLGHATVRVDTNTTSLLFDPVVGWRLAHLRRRSRVDATALTGITHVLLSHAHHDHLDLASLRRVRRVSDVQAWHAPRGAATILERAGFDPVTRWMCGDTRPVGGCTVHAVPAAHGGERHPRSRDEHGAEAIGYVVELADSTRIWFAGDTAYDDDVLAGIGDVDVALVPVGGWWRTLGPGHMDGEHAARAVDALHARIAIPIHWGTYHPIGLYRAMRPVWREPAESFQRAASASVDVRVLEVGGSTRIDLGRPDDRDTSPLA